MYGGKYIPLDEINTSYSEDSIKPGKNELSEDLLSNLRLEDFPLQLHDAPIQTKRKNPFNDRLVWILDESYVVDGCLHIFGDAEIYVPQRDITRQWKDARKSLAPVNKCPEREAKMAKVLQPINMAYEVGKGVFEGKRRDIPNGPEALRMYKRYFEHLKSAAQKIIEKINMGDFLDKWEDILGEAKMHVERIQIGFLHDIMEDIKVSFQTLKEIFGVRVAIGVKSISKEPLENFLDKSSEDYENELAILKDYEAGIILKDDQKYKDLEKKYKPQRNKQYFGHFKSFEIFKDNVRKIIVEEGVSLEELSGINTKDLRKLSKTKQNKLKEEIIHEIATNSILAKFNDRLDNLETQWDPNNPEKVQRKIKETEIHFLPIAKEVDRSIYDLLVKEILVLKRKLTREKRKFTES